MIRALQATTGAIALVLVAGCGLLPGVADGPVEMGRHNLSAFHIDRD